MNFKINKVFGLEGMPNIIALADKPQSLPRDLFTRAEIDWINSQVETLQKNEFEFNRLSHRIFVQLADQKENTPFKRAENLRKAGNRIAATLNEQKSETVTLIDYLQEEPAAYHLLEGIALGNYQFVKYQTNGSNKANTLKEVKVVSSRLTQTDVVELNWLVEAVWMARDLINEPASQLTATGLAEAFTALAHKAGIKVEVFNQNKIEALKMGGLLGVNKGSLEPATFTVMEYHPAQAVNHQPIVLVGKGVVFDTGGNNLKPSSSMNTMKSDMAGAAVVGATLWAIAMAGLPIHVIALIPATDNKINSNALVPGDILTISNGTTVEILNTDAEGRLILADALVYAQRFNPMLVIDIATLTGSAAAATGPVAAVAMHNGCENHFEALADCGFKVHERLVSLPMWDDYDEMLKSDIADLKQLGGKHAGAITAAKFLEHFTAYPWIHIDIAGTAFSEKRDSYRGLGASAFGLRLLFHFIKELSEEE